MTANPCLVLYGNSVFLAGIKAELQSRVALELITIEIGRPDVTELIRARKPRAVIFDIGTGPLDCVISLLRGQPGLLLIGVDPSSEAIEHARKKDARGITYALINSADLARVPIRSTSDRLMTA